MPTLSFGDWRPDLNTLDKQISARVLNCIPRMDGYAPFKQVEAWTSALPGPCRGAFYARRSDGSLALFAATATNLYLLNNTTFSWSNVSQGGGPYTEVSTNAHWQFAQFNSYVVAVQGNEAPQVYQLGVSTAFDDLGGSPPDAAYVAVVGRFLVLFGLTNNYNRIQWSGLNDIGNWTPGTGYSDFQDLPDGGHARAVVGGDLGIIIQDAAIRRMTYQPGSDLVFSIDKIAKDIGVIAPYAVVNIGPDIFFPSSKGFMRIDASGAIEPIGEEKVNRTFFAEWDDGASGLMLGAGDPNANIVLWGYRTIGGSGDAFNKGLVYNTALKRFSPVEISGQFLTNLAQPGLTLEALDAIAPGALEIVDAGDSGSGEIRVEVASTASLTTGEYKTITQVEGTTEANGTWQITVIDGTHFDLDGSTFSNAYSAGGIVGGSLDLLEFSLDAAKVSNLPSLSASTTDNKLGFFSGANLEASFETAEQSGDGRRIFVTGFRPLTDAASVFGTVAVRENLSDLPSYTPERQMDVRGFVPARRSTRYAGGAIRIPAGTPWTYAAGIRPETHLDGDR
jgi:hypothetical protein